MKLAHSISVVVLSVMMLSSVAAYAGEPSAATWLMQKSASYDTASKTHSLVITWRNGVVSDEYPVATHYEVYRSMVGHNKPFSAYDKIATIPAVVQSDGFIAFEDVDILPAHYYYYVVGLTDGTSGHPSRASMAGAPGSYCVNLNNPIIYMMSSPTTVAQPNDKYVYEAYGRHRSFRVQGWVRYNMVEGPAGMTIDDLTGRLTWTVPSNPDSLYSVKIRVSAPDESDAETFQEWSIRSLTEYETQVYNPNTTGVDVNTVHSFNVWPNPASDFVHIQTQGELSGRTLNIVSATGQLAFTTILSTSPSTAITTSAITPGVYWMTITCGSLLYRNQLVISR